MLDTRQEQVRDVTLGYFRMRGGRIEALGEGLYRVNLGSGSEWEDFDGNTARPDRTLAFDPETAVYSRHAVLVTAGHPYLDVIRTVLGREDADPRLADAHVRLQFLDPGGAITIPGIHLRAQHWRAEARVHHVPMFLLTYTVVYQSEERVETTVRMCYDARTAVARPDVLQTLDERLLAPGVPEGSRVPQMDLRTVLEASRHALREELNRDASAMSAALATQMKVEQERLRRHYENEIAALGGRRTLERETLERTLEKDLSEIALKMASKIEVRLLAVLRLWWPQVQYAVCAVGPSGQFEVDGFDLDLVRGIDSRHACPGCGNSSLLVLCSTGRHLTCGRCSSAAAECATCGFASCVAHGSVCAHCGNAVCHIDRAACSYGDHPDGYFCPGCRVVSFEQAPICVECGRRCTSCERLFPESLTVQCFIGGELQCTGHEHEPDARHCGECSGATCAKHGRATADGGWACQLHACEATCCHQVFTQVTLAGCKQDDTERLCPDHLFRCAGCAGALCEQHSELLTHHPESRVCGDCRAACASCPSDRAYLDVDLVACCACERSVCVEHSRACVVCGMPVCPDDQQTSTAGQTICPRHAARSTCCGQVFARPELLPCVDGIDELLCPTHRAWCSACGAALCGEHRTAARKREGQVLCRSCRRECAFCPTREGYFYHPSDIDTCCDCSSSLCPDHAERCVEHPDERVCPDDVQRTGQGETLCRKHSGKCTRCTDTQITSAHRLRALRVCAVCRTAVCTSHGARCEVCRRTVICTIHHRDLAGCKSCGRLACGQGGCTPAGDSCAKCGQQYCRHCSTADGTCTTCVAADRAEPVSVDQPTLRLLQEIRDTGLTAESATLDEMLQASPAELSMQSAANVSYRVVVVRMSRRSLMGLRRREVQGRVVVSMGRGDARFASEAPG